ncbi:MAG: IS1634 family transposase [Armatimonadetes bacterium]|nr:IS1634 family transposase [Armatimonadota bacterium]
MYLRTTTRKNKDSTPVPYFQIAENRWDPVKRRSEANILLNLGRADEAQEERLRKLAASIIKRLDDLEPTEDPSNVLIDAWPYGDLYAIEKLWERLQINKALGEMLKEEERHTPLERALFVMTANRCIAPYSKLYCYEQWMKEDIYFPESENVKLHHFYRALDFLERNKEKVEEVLFFRLSDLFNLDVDLIFYDTTTLQFEIDEEDKDQTTSDGRKVVALRKRGRPKEGKGHAPQVVVGMAVTRDGLPVRSWVFPGNTVDVSTVEQVKKDLKGWRLNRCIFVGDRGMVSDENLKILSLSGGRYILGMPMRRGDEVSESILSRPGKFAPVDSSALLGDNSQWLSVPIGLQKNRERAKRDPSLFVKEAWYPHKDAGARARRYVVCFNPKERDRQRPHRKELFEHLDAELEALKRSPESHPKRACELLASKRYGKYLRQDKSRHLHIDSKKVKREEHLDGKFVVYSNDDTLTASDLALGYKQLMRIEQGWRNLKSGLKVAPLFHRHPLRIRAHVTLCVLALLIERVAELACDDTWRNIRDFLRQIKAVEFETPHGRYVRTNRIRPEAARILKAMGAPSPKPLLSVSGPPSELQSSPQNWTQDPAPGARKSNWQS